jgi:SAM-dependent methyltransferase
MGSRIDGNRDWLKDFLNVYWLRPENALWRALNCKALAGLEIQNPSLNLSCGDGVFSFLLNGGNFSTDFDVFRGAGDLEAFYEDTDIFDVSPSEYTPAISRRPNISMTVGTDLKPNQLEKAKALDFYDEVVAQDNNEPLPFMDDRFETVYSNSAHWAENISLHLSEIERVLSPDGTAILQLKTPAITSFLEKLRSEYESDLGTELINIVDRGRSDHYAHLHEPDIWADYLRDAGLCVVERRQTVTWVHSRLWDIGLRPISPHLIRMANSLSTEQRRLIKEDWIDTWREMLAPFYDTDFDFNRSRAVPELVFVVEPEH